MCAQRVEHAHIFKAKVTRLPQQKRENQRGRRMVLHGKNILTSYVTYGYFSIRVWHCSLHTSVQIHICALYNGVRLSWRLQGPSNSTAHVDTVRFLADARGYVCILHVELHDLMCSQLSVRESRGMHLLKAIKSTGKEIWH